MMKKIGDVTVNDGKGLYDNEGLCDTLLYDLNRIPKILMDGQYIQFCAMIQSMAQRVKHLKDGIKEDLADKDRIIEDLKRANDSLINERSGGDDGDRNVVQSGNR
jgi:hypothetical protein